MCEHAFGGGGIFDDEVATLLTKSNENSNIKTN